MKTIIRSSVGLLLGTLILPCSANISFDGMHSYMALQPLKGRLNLTNVQAVRGWGEQSIIRASGYTTPDTWTEGYANDVIIGQQTGSPTMHLIYANSNAIAASGGSDAALSRTNSNAIIRLNEQAQSIFGPETLTITTPTYVMKSDMYISNDHLVDIQPLGGSCVIDGQGHTITFAQDAAHVVNLADDVVLSFQNVVIKNYTDAEGFFGGGTSAFNFGVNSEVHFDNRTTLELGGISSGTGAIDFFAATTHPMFFSGYTTIRGNVTNITLFPANGMYVRPNSSLEIENMTLMAGGNSLACAGESSGVFFNNCTLALASDFSFTSGNMAFFNDAEIKGNATFAYQSPSTLSVMGDLMLSEIIFHYDPPTDNRDLVQLGGFFSEGSLHLNGCTLSSTTTGMRLKGGQLIVDGKNYLSNPGATSLSEGICFGNGDSSYDLDIQIKPGSSLSLLSGIADYQNVN